MAGPWAHQVQMKIDQHGAAERLRRIESWCADWQIGFRVQAPRATDTALRIAFEEARFAKAFNAHFGGVIVPPEDAERERTADAQNEYDRLAREFPEDN